MLWFKKKKKPECHLIIEPYNDDFALIKLDKQTDGVFKELKHRYNLTFKGLVLGSDVTYEIRKPAKK